MLYAPSLINSPASPLAAPKMTLPRFNDEIKFDIALDAPPSIDVSKFSVASTAPVLKSMTTMLKPFSSLLQSSLFILILAFCVVDCRFSNRGSIDYIWYVCTSTKTFGSINE